MFIKSGRTELILLSWFVVCCECFIHLFSTGVQGRSPSREAWWTESPRSWSIFWSTQHEI